MSVVEKTEILLEKLHRILYNIGVRAIQTKKIKGEGIHGNVINRNRVKK